MVRPDATDSARKSVASNLTAQPTRLCPAQYAYKRANTISPAALASSTTSWCRKAMPKSPQMLASPYPPIDFFQARRNGKS